MKIIHEFDATRKHPDETYLVIISRCLDGDQTVLKRTIDGRWEDHGRRTSNGQFLCFWIEDQLLCNIDI